MSDSRAISQFLMAVAEAVQGLTNEELESIIRSGRIGELLRSKTRVRQPARSKTVDRAEVRARAQYLVENLSYRRSRDDARAYLETSNANRSILTEAAKLTDVHVLKQDTNDVIIAKLVENLVGSRLDSAAIRGG